MAANSKSLHCLRVSGWACLLLVAACRKWIASSETCLNIHLIVGMGGIDRLSSQEEIIWLV